MTGLGGLYLEGFIHGGAYFRNFTVVAVKFIFAKVMAILPNPFYSL